MRHARFDVAYVSVEGVDLPLKAAYLVLAEADDSDHPQWELLAYALDAAPIAPGTYRISVQTLDGRLLEGDAARIRSVDGAHVFRGVGALDGTTDDDLR